MMMFWCEVGVSSNCIGRRGIKREGFGSQSTASHGPISIKPSPPSLHFYLPSYKMSSPQPLIFAILFLAIFCLYAVAMPAQPEGIFERGQQQAEPMRAKRWSPYYYGAYGWGAGYPYGGGYYAHSYPYYAGYWW